MFGKKRHFVQLLALAFLVAPIVFFLLNSCGEKSKRPFDPAGGEVTRNLQLEQSMLAPFEIKVDSDYKFYYMEDHLVFLSGKDQPNRFASVHLGRGLQDNKYVRAERDFSGFYFDGSSMAGLPYTKEKHDSTSLDSSYPYYTFGGLTWKEAYRSGLFSYDRRGVTFEIEFSGLRPVQYLADEDWRLRVNAIGEGKLIATSDSVSDTVAGFVYYELIQLEGYNPIAGVKSGVGNVNYDWIALLTDSEEQVVVSTDSMAAGNILMKNFCAAERGDSIWFAEGSDNVDMISSDVFRDRKIHEWLANKKRLVVEGLDLSIDLALTDTRVFYTNGYAISYIEGSMVAGGDSVGVRGVLEHRQQPGTTSEAIK